MMFKVFVLHCKICTRSIYVGTGTKDSLERSSVFPYCRELFFSLCREIFASASFMSSFIASEVIQKDSLFHIPEP